MDLIFFLLTGDTTCPAAVVGYSEACPATPTRRQRGSHVDSIFGSICLCKLRLLVRCHVADLRSPSALSLDVYFLL